MSLKIRNFPNPVQAWNWQVFCWRGVTFFYLSTYRWPWVSLTVWDLSAWGKTVLEMWNFAPLSTDGHSLLRSMNIYLLPTGTGNWRVEYLEVTGLIFICLSINIYIHSITVTIYSWLILKLCLSLSLTPAYEQIRASKISAQGLINMYHWLQFMLESSFHLVGHT